MTAELLDNPAWAGPVEMAERDVLWEPMADPRFVRFYADLRPKITCPIRWICSAPQLPGKDAYFTCRRTADGTLLDAEIRLGGVPSLLGADVCSHELTHLVLLSEGWPYIVTSDPDLVDYAGRLANAPTDMVICAILRAYGWPAQPAPQDAKYHAVARRWGYSTPVLMRRLLEHLVEASFVAGEMEVI